MIALALSELSFAYPLIPSTKSYILSSGLLVPA